MSVKLRCSREALEAWWSAVSTRNGALAGREEPTFCEVFK